MRRGFFMRRIITSSIWRRIRMGIAGFGGVGQVFPRGLTPLSEFVDSLPVDGPVEASTGNLPEIHRKGLR
jgi:hypothetical protein